MRRLTFLLAVALGLLVPSVALAAGEGTVKGTVTPLRWAQEIEVCVVEAGTSETCTAPAADGTYSLENVPFFGAKVEFLPSVRSGLLREYYAGKTTLTQAAVIVLSPSRPIADNINENLREGGVIAGAVTAAGGGGPLAEVEVCAVSTSQPSFSRCTESNTAGNYEISGLLSDTYRVAFWGSGVSAEYESSQQQPVIVNAGVTTPGVDATLSKGGRIDGRVTAAVNGAPLANISVCLFSSSGGRPRECGYSDEAGDYSFVGLPSGDYQVGFSLESAEIGSERGGAPDGYESQYYDDVASRGLARSVSLLASTVVGGVDAALIPPPPPTPLPPAPSVTAPLIAAAPPIVEPTPQKKAAGCKKGYRKKRVKGKSRCVRQTKKRTRSKHKKKAGRHHGDKKSRVRGAAS